MKKILTIFLIISFVILAGCKKQETSEPGLTRIQNETTIENPKDFLSLHKEWTARLENLAASTDNTYSDWASGKISFEIFKKNINKIYSDMKSLNMETDSYADFKLNDNDKQKYNYEAITKAYDVASKDLNDFLYLAQTLSEKDTKAKYNEMIKNNFNADVFELKKLLKM